MDVRLKNHKEETHLQWKVDQIHRKYRLSLKLLHQDKEFLLKEHKKLLHLRVCEPYATVNNTLQEISETNTNQSDQENMCHLRSAPAGRRMFSANPTLNKTSNNIINNRFTQSALPKSSATYRFMLSKPGELSIMQLKGIALIDSISEKELAHKEELKRKEKERLKQLYRETFQKKMQIFLQTLDTV